MQSAEQYDLLVDLGKIKVDITMKQFLGVALICKSLLQSTLVRKMSRPTINEVTLSLDPSAPIVDVNIDGILVSGVQLDGGSLVNLMNMKTLLSLQFTGLKETKTSWSSTRS